MTAKLARTNQGGSVVSFLVVGLILVALVGGGIYLLQHRTTSDDAKKVATTSKSPSKSPSSSSSISTKPVTSSTAAPSPSKKSTPTPTPVKNTKPTPNASNTPTSTNMPATGPSDLMPAGVVLAVVTASMVYLAQTVRSRRHTSNQ